MMNKKTVLCLTLNTQCGAETNLYFQELEPSGISAWRITRKLSEAHVFQSRDDAYYFKDSWKHRFIKEAENWHIIDVSSQEIFEARLKGK